MKVLILLSTLFAASNAVAAKPIYISSGKVVSAPDALKAALEGKSVLGCKQMVAKPNESGTSIGLKPKKIED